jgi:putative transposase
MRRIAFNIPWHAHYLTFSCYKRQRLLADDILCRQLLSCWDQARRRLDFAIWADVIMPEHVHLLVWPKSERYDIALILRSVKESFARWVIRYWLAVYPDRLRFVSVGVGGRSTHRFWQRGGGYDRNLHSWKTIAKAIDYIEANPVRRGLVAKPCDWPWSSARCRRGRQNVPFVVDPPGLGGHSDAL